MEENGFSIKKALFGKISRKIIVLFAVLAIVLTFFGIYFSYLNSEALLKNAITNHLETATDSRGDNVMTLLQMEKKMAEQMAKSKVIKNLLQAEIDKEGFGKKLADVSERLKNTIESVKDIKSIFVLDKNGIVIASSNELDIGTDKSSCSCFFEAKKEPFIRETYISDKRIEELDFSAPVTDNEGEFLGVVVESFSTDKLNQITTDRKGLGETGKVYIINKDGYVITPLLFGEDTFPKQKVDTENSRNCFSMKVTGEKHIGHEAVAVSNDYQGIPVLGGHVYIPEMEWCLLAEITEEEAFGKAKKELILFAIFMFAITTVIAILAGSFIARSISRPIEKIHYATEQIKKGNFKTRVSIKTGDELEQLGTSFNKTAEALDRMDKEHKQLEHAKTEFLSITSHELRSPMTPMKAQLQMLEEGYFGKLNEKQKKSIDIVLKNTSRLDNIVVDFLEISRIEAARLKFRFVKANLADNTKMVVEEMNGFMPEKRCEIVTNVGTLPIIEVDPDRTMQILRNLINNAKKFSPANCKIVVSAKLKGEEIVFSVKDQGIGIVKENQKRVFEPFFQEEQTIYREHGGTGLGLTICKGIVEGQGGRIWVESEKGKGSTVYFTVPIKPVKEIKPIKLLFSPQENLEKMVSMLFVEMLGPMGKKEFEECKKNHLCTEDKLDRYIVILLKKGIITNKTAKEFRNGVDKIFKEGKGIKTGKDKQVKRTDKK